MPNKIHDNFFRKSKWYGSLLLETLNIYDLLTPIKIKII